MKKLIFILTLFSANTFAETMPLCSEDDSHKFADKARNAISAKTYYPFDAQAKELEGEGSVLVTFDKEWNILSIELLESTNSEELDIAMIDIVKTSNFQKPICLLEGHLKLAFPFLFKLEDVVDKEPAHDEVKNNCIPQNILDIKPAECS
jgi:hypothetical protein